MKLLAAVLDHMRPDIANNRNIGSIRSPCSMLDLPLPIHFRKTKAIIMYRRKPTENNLPQPPRVTCSQNPFTPRRTLGFAIQPSVSTSNEHSQYYLENAPSLQPNERSFKSSLRNALSQGSIKNWAKRKPGTIAVTCDMEDDILGSKIVNYFVPEN